MQKTEFIGNLGSDAELKDLNNTKVINFSVAVTEKWKSKEGEQKEETTWYECSYFTNTGGIAPFLTKGTKVYIEGKSKARAYVNNEGTAVAVNGVTVRSIELLTKGETQSQPQAKAQTTNQPLPQQGEDDLPF